MATALPEIASGSCCFLQQSMINETLCSLNLNFVYYCDVYCRNYKWYYMGRISYDWTIHMNCARRVYVEYIRQVSVQNFSTWTPWNGFWLWFCWFRVRDLYSSCKMNIHHHLKPHCTYKIIKLKLQLVFFRFVELTANKL